MDMGKFRDLVRRKAPKPEGPVVSGRHYLGGIFDVRSQIPRSMRGWAGPVVDSTLELRLFSSDSPI